MKLEKHFFGFTADDDQADLYRLSNDAGMDLAITNYGAAVVELGIPDRDGNRADVVLGFDSLSGYLAHSEYFGAIIGRYANRIAGGRFVLILSNILQVYCRQYFSIKIVLLSFTICENPNA